MNKLEIMKMSKMKQTVLNLQVHVLSFDDNDFKGLTLKAVDKFGKELPMNYRVISEDKYDLTQLIDNNIVEEQVEDEIEEEQVNEGLDKISNVYLFVNKDETNFLIGSCSKDNLTKLKIAATAIDPTFEISEMISDKDAKSLEIELDDGSVSNVFNIANKTEDIQIITIFNEAE